jgi:hypothetical protein
LRDRWRRAAGWRAELAYFLAAYVVYTAARWICAGEPGPAREHAQWIWDLEQAAGVAVEASVQRGLSSGVSDWVLSNVYLAAQLAVVPVSLIWLYRRSRAVYRNVAQHRSGHLVALGADLRAAPRCATAPGGPQYGRHGQPAGCGCADW